MYNDAASASCQVHIMPELSIADLGDLLPNRQVSWSPLYVIARNAVAMFLQFNFAVLELSTLAQSENATVFRVLGYHMVMPSEAV